jgi:hypothetical protein
LKHLNCEQRTLTGFPYEKGGLEVTVMKATKESVCPACGGLNGNHKDNCPFKR